ncbi:Hypothetical predicted protein [Xyrichtys novacula]|uniref:Uncharacterized protein n=1 Tax=Xyrichtys novacula TaxID=13765 RepID=A0AAV1FD92_XYRNO|nr:Hypothetical predicted protein [Xyrichtys novacula]
MSQNNNSKQPHAPRLAESESGSGSGSEDEEDKSFFRLLRKTPRCKVVSPEPSCLSLKSDMSTDRLIDFKRQQRLLREREGFSKRQFDAELSCLSLKSDMSTDRLIDFKGQHPLSARSKRRLKQPGRKIVSPEPSCLSLKSNMSTDRLIDFQQQQLPIPGGPGIAFRSIPTFLSLKSDMSTDRLVDFKRQQPFAAQRANQDNSEVSSKQINQVFQPLRMNIIAFVNDKLQEFEEDLCYPEILASGAMRLCWLTSCREELPLQLANRN